MQQLSQLFEHVSVGSYKENGLAILKGLSGPRSEGQNKKVIKVFKNCGLKITIKVNLHILSFLDITLDLRNNTHEPYREPDRHHVYVNKNSNHSNKNSNHSNQKQF